MKSYIHLIIFILFAIISPAAIHAAPANTELIVHVKPGLSQSMDWPRDVLDNRRIPKTDVFRLQVPSPQADRILLQLRRDSRIINADMAKMGSFPPESQQTGFQETATWQEMIHLTDIQKISDGRDIVVALLDSGIDVGSAYFRSMLWTNPGEIPNDGIDNDENGYVDDVVGMNFGDDSNNIQDYMGHGTHMSSAMLTVAPNIRIMVVKINQGGNNSFSEGDLMEAIYYAQNNGADILNMSLNAPRTSGLETAIQSAWQAGCVLNAAAGNSGEFAPIGFPASMTETHAVGAMYTETEAASWFSTTGPEMDIMAPGVSIPVTGIGGSPEYTTGTSVSTAIISGACAVILSMDNRLTPSALKDVLIRGVTDLGEPGRDDMYGYGILNGTALYDQVLVPVGQKTGTWDYTLPSQTPIQLYINTTNLWNEEPHLEWFALTGTMQDLFLPVYLFTGTELVMVSGSMDLTAYTYPYGPEETTLVAELRLHDLGLSAGDAFIFAYAYSTETGDIRFPEMVTIQVIK
ncbi:MAG: S8 family serine peptidase [Desulfatirhabdiaceae bacterium]